jgi:hypothetical protein
MSTVPLIVGAMQTNGHIGGLGGKALIYAGLFVLWGLIGLIPLLSKEPTAKPDLAPAPPDWTVLDSAGQRVI